MGGVLGSGIVNRRLRRLKAPRRRPPRPLSPPSGYKRSPVPLALQTRRMSRSRHKGIDDSPLCLPESKIPPLPLA